MYIIYYVFDCFSSCFIFVDDFPIVCQSFIIFQKYINKNLEKQVGWADNQYYYILYYIYVHHVEYIYIYIICFIYYLYIIYIICY